ncbi:hypothetical protein Tco_1010517, partial [Tanacetum coccineum]
DLLEMLTHGSRLLLNPGEKSLDIVNNIPKYLRNTKDRFLVYGREEELIVTGYYDASWQTDKDDSLALTKEPKDHGKSKHIDRKYHFVRSKVAEGHVIVKDVRSEDNSADPFTKALAKSKHDEHAWSIGLKDKIKF